MRFKSRHHLWRPVLIIGLLMLLLTFIGFENLVPSAAVVPGKVNTRTGQETSRVARGKDEPADNREAGSPTPAGSKSPADNGPDASAENSGPQKIEQEVGGAASSPPPSTIYYIRSHSILGDRLKGPSLPGAIEMLQRAVTKVGSTLPSKALVIDVDGLSNSQVSFFVYAKSKYDLSGEVAIVFEELELQQRKLTEGGQTGR